MDPREFLRQLMELRGYNPTSLAAAVRNATKQPQIHRFLSGEASEPRRTTLQPIADHFKVDVEAFYSPRKAGEEWAKVTGATVAYHPTEPLLPAEIPTLPLSKDVVGLFLDASQDEIDLAEDVLRQILGRSRRKRKPADKSLLQKLDREHNDGISGEDHDAPGRAHRKRA